MPDRDKRDVQKETIHLLTIGKPQPSATNVQNVGKKILQQKKVYIDTIHLKPTMSQGGTE